MSLNFNNAKPIRDIVYGQLKKIIIEGKISPGERIVEKEYAEKLNISRTPIREALRKLEIEGFVEYIPRKGVVVKELKKSDIIEIYDIRTSLETLAIKYTIQNITEDELKKLEDTIEVSKYHKKQGDIDKILEEVKTFNDILLYSCRRSRLIKMIITLYRHITIFRNMNMKNDLHRIDLALQEHEEILDAIKEENVEKAEHAVEKHLKASLTALLQKL